MIDNLFMDSLRETREVSKTTWEDFDAAVPVDEYIEDNLRRRDSRRIIHIRGNVYRKTNRF